MEFNSLIYPAPEPTSDAYFFLHAEDPDLKKQLKLVDHFNEQGQVEYQIPCIYLENRKKLTKETDPEEELLRQEQKMIEDSIRASIEQAKADGIYVEEEKKEGEKEKENQTSPEDRILLYFHGNAEDLFHNLYFLN